MADEKEKGKETKEVKGGSKNNMIMMGLLGFNMVAMLIIAGVTAYVFMHQPKRESIVDVVTNKERVSEVMKNEGERTPASIEKDAEAEKEAKAMGPTFALERFVVNLADKNASKYLNVVMDIELSNEELSEEIEKRLPQIRDIVILILSSKRYDQISTNDGRKLLREEIKHTINGSLTKGSIKNVYFTNFVIN
jgi:flagellar protein FliL